MWSNSYIPVSLVVKGNLLNYQKDSKYYERDYSFSKTFLHQNIWNAIKPSWEHRKTVKNAKQDGPLSSSKSHIISLCQSINMLWFLFWTFRFQIIIVGFTVSLEKIRNSSSHGQRISLYINISTKYIYVRKHTHNKTEKATEIMFCECNGN